MPLELARVALELHVDLGQPALQSRDRLGVAHAGHDVLALRVAQVVAVELLLAGDRVASERDAGARGRSHVAEDHHLDVDGGAEIIGDALHAAIRLGAVGVPRLEDRLDRRPQLHDRVRWELVAGRVLIYGQEPGHELAKFRGLQLGVGLDPRVLLRFAQGVLELFAIDAHHRLPEHLDEAAPGVERKALVLGQCRQALGRFFVEAEVEDRVHHAGHRELGPGADTDEQGIVRVAKVLARLSFERLERGRGLLPHSGRELAFVCEVSAAGFGGDGETGRDGHARLGHLSGAGALAAQEVSRLSVCAARGGGSLREVVDPFMRSHQGNSLREPGGAPFQVTPLSLTLSPSGRGDHATSSSGS